MSRSRITRKTVSSHKGTTDGVVYFDAVALSQFHGTLVDTSRPLVIRKMPMPPINPTMVCRGKELTMVPNLKRPRR